MKNKDITGMMLKLGHGGNILLILTLIISTYSTLFPGIPLRGKQDFVKLSLKMKAIVWIELTIYSFNSLTNFLIIGNRLRRRFPELPGSCKAKKEIPTVHF